LTLGFSLAKRPTFPNSLASPPDCGKTIRLYVQHQLSHGAMDRQRARSTGSS
jgi:hypothetical protein